MSKEEERAELHRVIWKIANDLRGAVDGWDFKSYVLGMLFYRFISEDLTRYLNEQEEAAGEDGFDYTQLSDEDAENGRKDTVSEKGYFILPSQLFCNVQKRCEQDANLNETLAGIFADIEGSAKGTPSEQDMAGLFSDLDVNSNKLGATVAQRNDKLCKIINAIASLSLGNRVDQTTNDTFGDAYEYLMTMYASNAGKSGGEFFTPQEVSRLVALLAIAGRKSLNSAYDPTVGSGSLLLQFKKILGDNVKNFYGQEINLTTYNLCRINMFLHGVNFERFDIRHGDTLLHPMHQEFEPFDAIGSNPPYSIGWDGDENPTLINDPRFAPAGVLAPKSKSDLAFTMHILSSLSTTGTAAIVEYPGVLLRGGVEKKIRNYLVSNNFVDTVIQLPRNLFFGVGIAVCIIVLKKSKMDNKVLFIDASGEFVKAGNKNKLSEDNISKIYNTYIKRKEVADFSKLIDNQTIINNKSNLSISSYVEKTEEIKELDIREIENNINLLIEEEKSARITLERLSSDLENIEADDAQKVTIEDISLSCYSGGTPSTKKAEYWENGNIPWMSSGEVHQGFVTSVEKKITQSGYDNSSAKMVPKHSVVIALAGQGKTRGTVAYTEMELCTNQSLCAIIPNTEVIDGVYLYYYLRTQYKQIRKVSAGDGTRGGLNLSMIKSYPVVLPSLEKQKEIVSQIRKLDEIMDSIKSLLAEETEMHQKQYEYYQKVLFDFTVD